MEMEPAGASDVDVLDDLLHDVDGEGDDFEDAEAFFDTDPDRDGDDLSADTILSQLDAVTSLDVEYDVQAENADEFHDSTSTPSSPQLNDASEAAGNPLADDAVQESSGSTSNEGVLPEQAQLSPLSGEDVVQAVLDLAADDEVLIEAEETRRPSEDEAPTAAQEMEAPQDEDAGASDEAELETSTDIPTDDTAGDATVDEVLDAVVASTGRSGRTEALDRFNTEPPPTPPAHEAISDTREEPSDLDALPPPAPTMVPVIVGSMNPVDDDNDDSDESQGEDEVESAPLPSPLHLDTADDDEDVLEVDAAVVSSLRIEEKQRRSKTATESDQQPKTTQDTDNALLKALPTTKAEDMGAIDLAVGEEVRVAHVTTLEPGSPFSDLHKAAGGSKLSADATFGISYQSMRKKVDEPDVDDKAGGYSLPSGPAFPDEREFESEMALTSDLSFSVATTAGASPSKGGRTAGSADDDEFAFEVTPLDEVAELSEEVLRARRESLEARKRTEEEELLKELKRATDEEKRLIESGKVDENAPSDAATAAQSGAVVESEELSITELHSIYKRGLGDQEVLMEESDEKEASRKPDAPLGRSMSVLGRIFSQTQSSTETIAEEAGGDDESEGSAGDEAADENAEETKTITEKSDVDEAAEWREIKLVQHESGSGVIGKAGSSPEAVSVSRMSYAEAAAYYAETPDVMQHRDIIVPEDFPRGSCFTCLSRPRLAFPGALEERDRVFCIAATAFDAHNDVVVGTLQTIYRKITKSPRDVLLVGRHWEDIGFQGTDPSTDLRGCGVLSLLQMLYLVETFPDLAHRFHALSQHPTRHFPFACVLINITLQCVVALRSGALYPECNKHSSVLSGMHRLHVALASQLHDAIQARTDGIPLIMRDVLDRGRSAPAKVIDEAFDGSSLRPSRPAAASSSSKTTNSKPKATERKESDNNLEFTEIGLHSVDEEG